MLLLPLQTLVAALKQVSNLLKQLSNLLMRTRVESYLSPSFVVEGATCSWGHTFPSRDLLLMEQGKFKCESQVIYNWL